jgi:hypothetical protein
VWAKLKTRLLIALVAVLPILPMAASPQPVGTPAGTGRIAGADAPAQATARTLYGQLPLSFVPAPTGAGYDFSVGGSRLPITLSRGAALLSLPNSAGAAQGPDQGPAVVPHLPPTPIPSSSPLAAHLLRLGLAGANAQPVVTTAEELPGTVNYFIGNDPARWRSNVPTYAKVVYHDVYPGIDVAYYGRQGQLEDDFIVHPGADPQVIALRFAGSALPVVNAQGDLALHVGQQDVFLRQPLTYQDGPTGRRVVGGRYAVAADGQVTFRLGAYDAARLLVIDPVLAYATYLGGSNNDAGTSVAVDSAGNAYITGTTNSNNFPTTNGAFQTSFAGGSSDHDVFVSKLNPSGSALLYSTYLGGSGDDQGNGIAVDTSGNTYITGDTNSSNFPTTSGALQTSFSGGYYLAFVSKLNPSGTALIYSSYLGSQGSAFGNGIAVDSAGDAYVTGYTGSNTFPTTSGAFQTSSAGGYNAAFVSKFNPSGSSLLYSTYLSGNNFDRGNAIAVDSGGDAYVTGYTGSSNFPTTSGAFQVNSGGGINAFVSKLNPSGGALLYSTYLGGSGNNNGNGIAVDSAGDAYVTGSISSGNFPTTRSAIQTSSGGGIDAFVSKLNPSGSALLYSTYLGGSGYDAGYSITVDSAGSAYVTGGTNSTNFPTTSGALQTSFGGGSLGGNAFLSKLNPLGNALLYSTYIGGSGGDSGNGIAVDSQGNVYVAGSARSPNFPTTNGAFQTSLGGAANAFVLKLALGSQATPSPTPTMTATPSPTAVPMATVTASPTNTATPSPTATGGSNLSLPLSAGWHLVSFSFQPTSTSLTTVLSSLGSSYDIVLGFDASQGGAQSYFTSPSMRAFNTLTALLPLHGYWLHLTTGSTLSLTGTPLPAGTTLALTPGWNLVGYGGTSPEPLATALGHLNNAVDITLGFDAGQGGALSYFTAANMAPFNNLTTLQPNAGYWLHMTGNGQQWAGQ